ncbi:MAG: DUF2690 domain-containing protein [Anaerolineales bacterium]
MAAKWLQSKVVKVLYGALLGLMLVGLIGAFPDNASAACSGNGCNGKDPNVQGCTGISTKQALTTPIIPGTVNAVATVQLRYSSSCNAKWARTINSSTLSWFAAATDWWPPYAYPANLKYSKSSATWIGVGATVYTGMLGPSYPVQACGKAKTGLTPIAVPIAQSTPGYCTIFG